MLKLFLILITTQVLCVSAFRSVHEPEPPTGVKPSTTAPFTDNEIMIETDGNLVGVDLQVAHFTTSASTTTTTGHPEIIPTTTTTTAVTTTTIMTTTSSTTADTTRITTVSTTTMTTTTTISTTTTTLATTTTPMTTTMPTTTSTAAMTNARLTQTRPTTKKPETAAALSSEDYLFSTKTSVNSTNENASGELQYPYYDSELEGAAGNMWVHIRDEEPVSDKSNTVWVQARDYEHPSTTLSPIVQSSSGSLLPRLESPYEFKLGIMEFVLMVSVFLNLILIVLVLDLGLVVIVRELKKSKKVTEPVRLNNQA